MSGFSADALRALLHERYGLDGERLHADWLARLSRMVDATGDGGGGGERSEAGLDEHTLEAALASAATVNESMFLRHSHHFDWLVRRWLPDALRRKQDVKVLRILSAPCACGEEPYSMAARVLPLLPSGWRVDVLGVDLSPACVQAAEAARFGLWALRGVDLERERWWLRVDGSEVRVADAVRRVVRFRRHNLLDPPPAPGTWDLVACRNALIYFHPLAVRRAWQHLGAALAPGGAVLPGPADPAPPDDIGLTATWQDEVRVVLRARDAAGRAAIRKTGLRRARRHSGGSVSGPRTRPAAEPRPTRAPTPGATETVTPKPVTAMPVTPEAAAPANALEVARAVAAQGKLGVAARLLQEAAEADPLDPRPLVTLALVSLDLGREAEALQAARAAGFLAPDSAFAAFVLADVLQRTGQPRQARSRYRWAANLVGELPPDAALPHADGLTASQLAAILATRHTALATGGRVTRAEPTQGEQR